MSNSSLCFCKFFILWDSRGKSFAAHCQTPPQSRRPLSLLHLVRILLYLWCWMLQRVGSFKFVFCTVGNSVLRTLWSMQFLQVSGFSYKIFLIRPLLTVSIGGSVVEFSPATRETGVRFPANARFSEKN